MPSSTQIDSRLSPQKHLPSLFALNDVKETENNTIKIGNGSNNLTSNHVTLHQQGICN